MLIVLRISKSIKFRLNKFGKNLRSAYKIIRSFLFRRNPPETVIWIFGCQRSGTTFLENIFRQDVNSAVYGEFSDLTIGSRKTVLKDPESIATIIANQNSRYVVIRPLFESDRAHELMALFPNSIGIWLFRDCTSVVNSMKCKWGDDFFDISRQVESDAAGSWRLENAIDKICFETDNGSTDERYAKYWLLRNSIPFENNLVSDKRMVFVEYTQLVEDPKECISRIFKSSDLEVWRGFAAHIKRKKGEMTKDLRIESHTLLETKILLKKLRELTGH